MLLDANILLFAVDARSPLNASAERWLTEQLKPSLPSTPSGYRSFCRTYLSTRARVPSAR